MKTKIHQYIIKWVKKGYFNGIPDNAPLRLEHLNKVPSYRKICIAILKNDIQLKSLGIERDKCLLYDMIKKQELKERGVIKQTDLKL